jgi:hypothetical protein
MPRSCHAAHACVVTLLALVSAMVWFPGEEARAAALPNLVSNPSLERATRGFPDCFEAGGYGSNVARFERSTHARTGKRPSSTSVTAM